MVLGSGSVYHSSTPSKCVGTAPPDAVYYIIFNPDDLLPDKRTSSAESADGVRGSGRMGLMSILKKMKQKEKDVRLLMLYPMSLVHHAP